MGNMSYCRFCNTRMDLEDCLFAVSDKNEYPISQEESNQGIKMFKAFLNFCIESNIIPEYDEAEIENIFIEHNKVIR